MPLPGSAPPLILLFRSDSLFTSSIADSPSIPHQRDYISRRSETWVWGVAAAIGHVVLMAMLLRGFKPSAGESILLATWRQSDLTLVPFML